MAAAAQPDQGLEPGFPSTIGHDAPFYVKNIDHMLAPETRALLEQYSHIPPAEQSAHIHRIRDQAFAIRAYPCTGLGAFLRPQMSRFEVYPEVLRRVKAGGTLMDVGAFVGHDLRRLVFDGAPSDRLWGVDVANHWDVGYELFRDRGRFQGHFIEADIVSDSHPELEALKGKVDVISISQVLHLWDWDGQVRAGKALAAFSKPGTLLVGFQLGSVDGRAVQFEHLSPDTWWHNPESFVRFMDQVGRESGTKWVAKGKILTMEEMGWDMIDISWVPPGAQIIEFSATRVE